MLVYSDVPSGRPSDGGLALWNRGTGEGVQLAMDYYLQPYYPSRSLRGLPGLSPDGRYMMMKSQNFLYVWDLQGLTSSAPYPPTYIHEVKRTRAARFIDNTTIETIYISVSAYEAARALYTQTTYHWDVVTGEKLFEESEVLPWDYFGFIAIWR